jgi:hypothetical protein
LKRLVASAACALALVLAAPSALAQGAAPGGFGPNIGPPQGVPQASDSNSPNQSIENPPEESPRSVKLFDQKRTVPGFEINLGPVWFRKAGPHGEPRDWERGTGDILAGITITTHWKPFYISGYQMTHFRVLDSKSFIWSVLSTGMGAGVRLGPFEPEARLGVGLIQLDAIHGEYNFSLLSPRVAMGVGLRLGKIRLDIQAHTEYLWRWFGPDYLIRGVSLGLRFDVPRPKGPDFSEKPR